MSELDEILGGDVNCVSCGYAHPVAKHKSKTDHPNECIQTPTECGLVKELVEALEFYANRENWHSPNSSSRGYHVTDQNGSMDRYHAKVGGFLHGCFVPDAGDRARAALTKTSPTGKEPKAPEQDIVEVPDIDVEIAIAEAIQLLPRDHAYEDKGVPVLRYLKNLGYRVTQIEGQEPKVGAV